MSTRSKGRRHGSNGGVDGGLLTPNDVTENDYDDDYDLHESDYDEADEDADASTRHGSTKTSSSITTSITTVITTVVESFYDVCFEVEEFGRRLVGASSRREQRERLKRLRLAGAFVNYGDQHWSGSGALYGEAGGSDRTGGMFGARRKDGDISYEAPRVTLEEDGGVVAAWCWWLLPLLLLLAVFFAMTAWAYLLGADDLTTAITATTENITTTAFSAVTIFATSAATTTSTIVSYITTAAVTTFDATSSAVVSALGWSADCFSWLWSSIVGLSLAVFNWLSESLIFLVSAIGSGLSSAYYFVLSLFLSSGADGDVVANDPVDVGVQTPGVVQSTLYAISSSVSSLYLGAVSSAKAAGTGTLALATAGSDAAYSGLSSAGSGLLLIPSAVVSGVSAVTDVLYSFVLWVWEGMLWGVSWMWEGLGLLLWWLWGAMMGLGSLVGGGVVSMAGSTANKTIGAANSVKLALAPIFEASSSDTSSTVPSVPVAPVNVRRDPPLPPSGPAIEELVAQLLQSEALHQRLGAAVTTEVATQTSAAAAAQVAQQQQTALLLKQLQQHHQNLKLQLRQLAAGLARVETEGNSGRAELSLSLDEVRLQREKQQQRLDSVHGALEEISRQIEEMQHNHTLLSAEVKSCCQRSLLSLADVDTHVTSLIASLIGYQAASGGDAKSPSPADLKAWMATYFVAKDEMEQQIGQLTITLEKQVLEYRDTAASTGSAQGDASTVASLDAKTLEQTQQLVMAHVTEQLHEKLREQITQDLQQEIQTQLDTKVPETIKETLQPQGEFSEILQAKLQQEVEAKLKSNEVKTKMKYEVEAQLKSYLEEGGELKKGLQEDLVAYFEPQLHSHVAATVKNQVEDQVQARVEQELEAKLEDKLVQTRLDFKADLDVLDQKVNDDLEQNTNQNVLAALTSSLPHMLPSTATQPAALNDTVKAIVADAVALHMAALGGKTCDKTGSLPPLQTTSDAEEDGSTLAAALLHSASTLAGVGIASSSTSSGGALNLAAAGGGGGEGDGGGNLNITLATDGSSSLLTRTEVQRIVAAALKKYDADRTGMVDHALESGGGVVVSTRCTEAYEVNQAQLSWLGFSLYRYSTNTPRSIIQPDRHPGQCWAFKGSQGYVVLRLVAPIQPSGFSLEHIPKEVAPFGTIDSAPKNFTVWGLNTENDEGYELGSYQYQSDGDALQYFAVDNPSHDYYPYIELKINSNHGNMQYTCVYRFRVHGTRMRI